jgi:hypothetical protein
LPTDDDKKQFLGNYLYPFVLTKLDKDLKLKYPTEMKDLNNE